jgi:hypothetical protein
MPETPADDAPRPPLVRCAVCGTILGALLAGELVSRVHVRGGQKRTLYGPRRVDCERCGAPWMAPAPVFGAE